MKVLSSLLTVILLSFSFSSSCQDIPSPEGSPMLFGFTYGSTLDEMKAHAEAMKSEGKDMAFETQWTTYDYGWSGDPTGDDNPFFIYNVNGCKYELQAFFVDGKLVQIVVGDLYDSVCEKMMQDYIDKHYTKTAPDMVGEFYRYDDFLKANRGLELHPAKMNEVGVTATEGLGNTYRFCSLEYINRVLSDQDQKDKEDENRINKGID